MIRQLKTGEHSVTGIVPESFTLFLTVATPGIDRLYQAIEVTRESSCASRSTKPSAIYRW